MRPVPYTSMLAASGEGTRPANKFRDSAFISESTCGGKPSKGA